MVEEYKGYRIDTGWNDEALGFDFHVGTADGREAFRSEEPFFYEENALAVAKKAIDEETVQEGVGDEHSR